ncbi:PDZ domain-containing protein [Modestobacter sp. VKM Ac-2979]|uniref:YlbL family protein n=1 Tax=unclassified Modestobacter TaxID=2643866 RepID=UPI0022AB9F28|nr:MULTISPECIES: PDZ domain-containing protein [unclassified Modestobacter]MCZ2812445.1 PDZ domain-containing protein [Modestobacter sp. VKM Ac-2979]MCZ2841335.1 PDZ domain-containing protein [Modestobacter sp. VKM Ac-2980]
MTRRTTVLVAGTLLLLVFGMLGTLLPVPFVAQVPGPTYNTLGDIDGTPIISVEGREPNDVSGNLNLTTVGIPQDELTLVGAVQGWFDSEVVVVPREQVYPSGRSVQETQAENRQAFLTSEQAARGAALGELGYSEAVVVQELAEESASEGRLEAGDAIDAVDGTPTSDLDALSAVLAATPPGSEVVVDYRRRGEPGSTTVTTSAAAEGEGSALGVLVLQTPYAPFDVGIEVADVGGPSAGLMLALGIIDLVGDTDLTEGAVIAGTGTIDTEGVVGPIGGIPLKLVAAREIGAELFLVPAENCAEAVQNAQEGLPTARVATLDDALTALADLRAGRTPTPC